MYPASLPCAPHSAAHRGSAVQHAEQIARKEAKVRAAKRRQSDADVRARADRPEELFQHEREERDRLRVEKGTVFAELRSTPSALNQPVCCASIQY